MTEFLLERINFFIDEKLHDLFFNKQELSEITEVCNFLMNELHVIQSKVVQCFPPKYDIFNVFCKVVGVPTEIQ